MKLYSWLWSNWEDGGKSVWVGQKLYNSHYDAVLALLTDFFDIAEQNNIDEWREAIIENLDENHKLMQYKLVTADFIYALHDEIFLYGERWSKILEFEV